ncbi:MAG: hypothetical protein A3D31_00735 [Candidatus Fluviicola riflensis]|nr:MAG: hypothetical protein CHH17_04810 [Candidatus Fluviicola riflensis]OGS76134.1 MAG: hypothetical protein A3D31_00735 [Candidatus Fluviicola riflensis]OGS83322.1 MAG: hypothetical protein A2724_01105 [Fluviicola sp. RIFCSPHIGHO2_01_FULL_43_53]OGS83666.1 MAG: hypothetical protein A3E30_17340 [Fluviicola sp. RIFCSPHIGHO2_12_FULL_43_24]
MPKILCECDEVIRLHDIPSPNVLMMISDEEYDEFSGLIDAEELYMRMKMIVKCPSCKRLYFFSKGIESPAEIYTFERLRE